MKFKDKMYQLHYIWLCTCVFITASLRD